MNGRSLLSYKHSQKKPTNQSGTEIKLFPDKFSATCGTWTILLRCCSLAIVVSFIVEPDFKKWEFVPLTVGTETNSEESRFLRHLAVSFTR